MLLQGNKIFCKMFCLHLLNYFQMFSFYVALSAEDTTEIGWLAIAGLGPNVIGIAFIPYTYFSIISYVCPSLEFFSLTYCML